MLHGNIIGTILHIAAFLACTTGVYFYKKSFKKLNGMVWMLLSIIITMCAGSVAAGIISFVHIPVNIYSLGVIYLLFGAALWFFIRKEGKRQEYLWEKFDVIATVLITIAVAAVCMKIFTPSLFYAYFNSDAGLHLKEATAIVRSQAVEGMYFIHLQNALIIELIQPFVRIVDWYKGYVLADCVFLWLESMFFLVMIRRFAATKLLKFLSVIAVVFYFMGYPFLSFYYSFVYWAMGTLMIGFLVMAMRMYEESEIDRKYAVLMLMLGCFGVLTCYMLFAPITYVCVFVYLIIIAHREGKIFTGKNVLLALKVFLLPVLVGGYYCLYGFFTTFGTSIAGALGNNGGIYTELYMDFFWTLFPVFFMLVHTLRKKKFTPDVVFFLGFFLFTGGMLLLTLTHHVSTYYYYKTYYPLWMLCWLLTFQAVALMMKEAKEALMAYGMLVAMFIVLCYGKIEYRIVTSTEKITGGLHSTAFFTLYQNNWSFIAREHGRQDEHKLDLYEYVAENLADEKMIPLMTEANDYGETYFYEGVSGYDFPDFYEWRHTSEELEQAYYDWDVHYAVMLKDSDFDKQHGKEVLKRKDISIAYETKAGYVLEFTYK